MPLNIECGKTTTKASSDRDLWSYWVKVKGLPPRAGEASGGSDG